MCALCKEQQCVLNSVNTQDKAEECRKDVLLMCYHQQNHSCNLANFPSNKNMCVQNGKAEMSVVLVSEMSRDNFDNSTPLQPGDEHVLLMCL